jgi:hypothetical protein
VAARTRTPRALTPWAGADLARRVEGTRELRSAPSTPGCRLRISASLNSTMPSLDELTAAAS